MVRAYDVDVTVSANVSKNDVVRTRSREILPRPRQSAPLVQIDTNFIWISPLMHLGYHHVGLAVVVHVGHAKRMDDRLLYFFDYVLWPVWRLGVPRRLEPRNMIHIPLQFRGREHDMQSPVIVHIMALNLGVRVFPQRRIDMFSPRPLEDVTRILIPTRADDNILVAVTITRFFPESRLMNGPLEAAQLTTIRGRSIGLSQTIQPINQELGLLVLEKEKSFRPFGLMKYILRQD